MYNIDLSNKTALVFGVANQRSIAHHIARLLHQAGANLILAYQNERVRNNVEKAAAELGNATLVECDVSDDANVEKAFADIQQNAKTIDVVIHSIAFANREDLGGNFAETPREGFRLALDISAYSLIPITKYAKPLMQDGGSIMTMTFQASERVFPGYNVMGTAKAALEHEVRQLAFELGPENIRVNALSAGPLDTLSSRVISGYTDMKTAHREKSPLQRNITHEEVAKTALYLASDLSSGVTGEILHVDTGYHIIGF